MNRIWLFILSLLLLLNHCNQPRETESGVTENFHLYLLIGQSNMAGRGEISDIDRTTHPRVKMLSAENKWIPAREPAHFDKPIAGVGPGLAFGKQMANADSTMTIGLIPCAVGGSKILDWQPGVRHEQTKIFAYDSALARTRFAQKFGTLKGILWHQGESDAKPERATKYHERLTNLLNRLRIELHAPDVPILLGELGEFLVPKRPETLKINSILQQIAKNAPNIEFVSSRGLTPMEDNIHFDAPSARELGRRFAVKMIEMQSR